MKFYNLKIFQFNIVLILCAVFFSCEVDFERNWCQEKLAWAQDNNIASDPTFVYMFICSSKRKKKDTESQEEYDTYLRNYANNCSESINLQILNYYIELQKIEKCKKINRLQPTIHEPTQ